VVSKEAQLGSKTFYDEASSVKWMVYGSNQVRSHIARRMVRYHADKVQWISYDDEQSFTAKKKYLTSRCLKGLMIWSIDLDTQDHQAMTGLFGEEAMEGALRDTGLDPDEAEQLSFDLSAWTGERCYTTPTCTDGSRSQRGPDQVCKSGYTAVEMAHSPVQKNGVFGMHGECALNWFRYICCPTKAMPQNCEWVGAPERSVFGCDRGCGASQFELNYDTYIDARGRRSCYSGARSVSILLCWIQFNTGDADNSHHSSAVTARRS
jgi:chitinase